MTVKMQPANSRKYRDWAKKFIRDFFGTRCKEFEDGCPTCEAWKRYDENFKVKKC